MDVPAGLAGPARPAQHERRGRGRPVRGASAGAYRGEEFEGEGEVAIGC